MFFIRSHTFNSDNIKTTRNQLENEEMSTNNREEILENNLTNVKKGQGVPIEPSEPSEPYYSCYHNDCDFHTDNKLDYENMIARHWHKKHTGIPKLYHTKTELEKYGLKPQGKEWEI